jgi:hypothetical protein
MSGGEKKRNLLIGGLICGGGALVLGVLGLGMLFGPSTWEPSIDGISPTSSIEGFKQACPDWRRVIKFGVVELYECPKSVEVGGQRFLRSMLFGLPDKKDGRMSILTLKPIDGVSYDEARDAAAELQFYYGCGAGDLEHSDTGILCLTAGGWHINFNKDNAAIGIYAPIELDE